MLTPSFSISRDINGNKTCRIKPTKGRGFSVQTLGNLPETHRRGVCKATPGEFSAFVAKFGTPFQRQTVFAAFLNDGRFSIAKECTGEPLPVWVIRFCGEFITSEVEFSTALARALDHKNARAV